MKLTTEQNKRRAELVALSDRHAAAWKRHASFSRSGASSASLEQQAKIRAEVGADFTNEQRSELERLEFIASEPAKYFAYVKCDDLGRPSLLTTFTGDKLGVVVSFGAVYESPEFYRSSKRQNIRVHAINGRTYSGTYYKSSGDYCRLKICKA